MSGRFIYVRMCVCVYALNMNIFICNRQGDEGSIQMDKGKNCSGRAPVRVHLCLCTGRSLAKVLQQLHQLYMQAHQSWCAPTCP